MREISTRTFAKTIASKVSSNRASENLLEFTKDKLQEYGSPVIDELAEECLNTTLSSNTNHFVNEYEMAKNAFTDVMLKWFGDTVNIAYDSYFNGEMIKVDGAFETFRETTGENCPNCDSAEIYAPSGGVECSEFCGYSECY